MMILGQEWVPEAVLESFRDMTPAERGLFLQDRVRVAGPTHPRRAREWAEEELQRQEAARRRLQAQAQAEIKARKS